MKLGVFTPVFGQLSTAEMIAKVQSLQHVEAVELGTGGWPGRAHLDDLEEMIEGHCRATTYKQMLADAGLTISALSCHSNPLHPDLAVARSADELFRQTVRLAEKMQVPTVVTFSGCPGDSDGAQAPELDHHTVAAGIPRGARLAMGAESDSLLEGCGEVRRRPRRHGSARGASGISGLQRGHHAEAARRHRPGHRHQFRSEPLVLAGGGHSGGDPRAGRLHFPRARQGPCLRPTERRRQRRAGRRKAIGG